MDKSLYVQFNEEAVQNIFSYYKEHDTLPVAHIDFLFGYIKGLECRTERR